MAFALIKKRAKALAISMAIEMVTMVTVLKNL